MNNTKARKLANDELREILDSVDLVSGASLGNTKVASSNKVLYWRNAITSEAGFDKPIYVVYTITSSDEATVADNKVKSREVIISLGIYTTGDLNSREIFNLVDKIENALDNKNWDVLYEEELFDNDNKISHIPLTISKNF